MALVPGVAPAVERIEIQMVPGRSAQIDAAPAITRMLAGQSLLLTALPAEVVGDRISYAASCGSAEGAAAGTSETMRELLRGTRVEESGPRPLSVTMLGIEPRVVLLEHWPVRPVLAGRIAVARRRFEAPNPRVPRARPPLFASHAWGWGGAAGAKPALWRRGSLETAVPHERLRFGAYGALVGRRDRVLDAARP